MSGYFWLAVGWSVLGFTVGFTSCWLWMCSVRKAQRSSICEDCNSDDEGDGKPTVSGTRTLSGRTVIGLLILLLLVVSSVRYYQRTDCQTRYNEAVAVALAETSDARGKETLAEANKANAQAAWLRTLLNNPGDQRLGLDATNNYLRTLDEHVAALQELERVRATHPMPAAANCR